MLPLKDSTSDRDTLPMLEVYFPLDIRHFDVLTFFAFVFAKAIICFFAIFVFITFDIVYLKSVRLKHDDCSSHFLNVNYRVPNLNFLR